MHHISRNGWIGLVVAAVLVGGGIALFLGGYVPQIGRFFAAEPGGYIPFCAGYGQRVTLYADGGAYPSCCSGLLPTVADAGRFETPGASAEASDDAAVQGRPTGDRTAYCVMPQCKVYRKSVHCIEAPCEPVIEIVCPPGVTPPPTITPYPTRTSLPSPYPTSVPIEMYLERTNDSPAGVTEPAVPGEVKSVRVMIHAAQSISAAKVILTYDRRFEFLSFDVADLPEVLMSPIERPFQNEFGTWGQMEVSVGSGPTPVGGYVIAGIAQFRVKEDTTIGTNLSIDPDSMSEVAAVGRPGNSLSLVRGSLGYAVALLPTGGPGQPGDADGDGDVDIFDYNIVVSEFGRTNDFGYDRGDLDKNGKVDIFDYNLVVSNFGRGVQ